MGSVRRTLCTGLLAVVAFVEFAPAAHAAHAANAVDDGAGVSLIPPSPAAGTDVALRVSGCSGAVGTAVSEAFVADARLTGGGGTLTGDTRIRTTLRPGSYDVRVACAGDAVAGRITVAPKAGSAGPAGPAGQSGSGSYAQPSAPASPTAPVEAGGGGTARLASVDARVAGPGTAQTVTGLVLAGVAAVAVGLRGVRGARRSRGTR
ncbi:hypothetical protein ACFY0F_31125 [Streptomyces sp. NPDC001544]|uniref:hypothetical protein n=1 Tax=Streptomyces sp. NPDC001544 TaxID=3364584 RepID=UPI00368D3DF7